MKKFFEWMLCGAAVCLGGKLVTKGIEVFSSPYKRTKLKKEFQNIKNTFTQKD